MYLVFDSATGISTQAKPKAPATGTGSIPQGLKVQQATPLELGQPMRWISARSLKPVTPMSEVADQHIDELDSRW